MVDISLTPTGIDPEQYPITILQGDVLATLFKAVQARLKAILPEEAFVHTILPPNPGKTTWQTLAKNSASVATGFGNWHSSENTGAMFSGTVSFPVWIMLTQLTGEALYVGTGQIRGMGIMGVMAAIAGGMHNWTVPNIGTCCVRNISIPATPDWFDERSAIIWAELVFHNISLSNADTIALLNDFITETNQIETITPQIPSNTP